MSSSEGTAFIIEAGPVSVTDTKWAEDIKRTMGNNVAEVKRLTDGAPDILETCEILQREGASSLAHAVDSSNVSSAEQLVIEGFNNAWDNEHAIYAAGALLRGDTDVLWSRKETSLNLLQRMSSAIAARRQSNNALLEKFKTEAQKSQDPVARTRLFLATVEMRRGQFEQLVPEQVLFLLKNRRTLTDLRKINFMIRQGLFQHPGQSQEQTPQSDPAAMSLTKEEIPSQAEPSTTPQFSITKDDINQS